MKIQILVPHYKEPFETVKNLLNSIESQQGVDLKNDIGVLMINDGGIPLNRKVFNRYSFPIEYHKEKNEGIAKTRNKLLDRATGEYIVFCDADDMFASNVALYSIIHSAEQGAFDELVSYFYIENPIGENQFTYGENQKLIHPFIHGKAFRLAYLREKNIRFNTEVKYHEDVYFSFLAHSCADVVKMLPQFAYIWKQNPNSVTHQPNFSLINYHDSLHIIGLVCDELINRNKLTDARFYFTCCLFNTFVFAHTATWLSQINNEYWLDMCNWVRWLWEGRGQLLFNEYDLETVQRIWNDTLESAYNDGTFPKGFIKENFNEWFVDIIKTNGQKCLTWYPDFTKHIEQ